MKRNEKDILICKEMKKHIDLWTYFEEGDKDKKNRKINDFDFVKTYRKVAKVAFIGDSFYDLDGVVSIQSIQQNIQDIIRIIIKQNLDSKVNSYFNSLVKNSYSKNQEKISEIHTLSNKLNLRPNKIIVEDKEISATRLNVNYNEKAKSPTLFLEFLKGLLEENDIPIVQEYMGYCLLKNNKAQKGLFILGKGGEGKSLLGKIFCDILGESVTQDSLVNMLDDRFGLSNIINKLVIYDDELSELKLKSSDNFKKMISGGVVKSEKKFQNKIEIPCYCKFFACGNHMIKADTKDTDAFKRRLLIIIAKPKDKKRIDDRDLYKKLIKEKEEIFKWVLEGLYRLINQEYHFSYEEEMAERVEILISSNSENDLLTRFLSDRNYIKLVSNKRETSQNIHKAFILWALEKEEKLLDKDFFYIILGKVANDFNLRPNWVYKDIGDKNKLRGYENIEIIKRNYTIN